VPKAERRVVEKKAVLQRQFRAQGRKIPTRISEISEIPSSLPDGATPTHHDKIKAFKFLAYASMYVSWRRSLCDGTPKNSRKTYYHTFMLSSFLPTFYVQISPELVTIRNAKTGDAISEVPVIAISKGSKQSVVGIGREARLHESSPSVNIVNPFAHPRSLVSDFTAGEQLLKALLRHLQGNSIFRVAPRVVMHLMGEPTGGFTQIEVRAFREMAIAAGASKVAVWQGRGLSDQELISGKFPTDGQVLERS
jgi:rod shape-determining protein MreB